MTEVTGFSRRVNKKMDDVVNKITVRFSLWYELLRTIDTVFVVLLVLKLFKVQPVAGVSWLWITAPLWIPLSFAIIVVLICFGPSWIRSMARWMKRKFGKEDQEW